MSYGPSILLRREPSRSREHRNPLDLQLRKLRRFLRSPKGHLLLVLVGLAAVAAPSTGVAAAVFDLSAAIASAITFDLVWVRLDDGVWRIPGSALLSGLIVGLVLSAQEPWYVAATAGVLAIAAKHLLRLRRTHIFNPAAVGLLAVFFLFASGQSWWGAFSNLPLAAVVVVLAGGMLVANRANKLPASLAFFSVYVSLFTLAAVLGHGTDVADVFRSPFVNMAVFFGFLMLTDPPTSPVPFPAQVWFGASVAVISFITYMATHSLYYLLAGVLVANLGFAASQAIDRLVRRHPSLRTGPASLAGFDNRVVNVGVVATVLAVLVILGAAVALLFQGGGDSSGAARISDSAQPDSIPAASAATSTKPGIGSAPAVPAPGGSSSGGLSFQDHFAGTVVQQTDASGGGTVDVELAATGDRPVQLGIKLQVADAGRGRTRVTGNEAILSDAGGKQLCRGRVTAFDDTGFTAQCQGPGGGGTSLMIVGTITAGTAGQMEGNLQVAPFSG